MSLSLGAMIERCAAGVDLSDQDALRLVDYAHLPDFLPVLMDAARRRARLVHGDIVTYSPKVFIPLTHLCRDVCRYCTFATTPKKGSSAYMSVDQALSVARRGAELGCHEALLTLGDRPEARYRVAREALGVMGFADTLSYVAHVAEVIKTETGLLPHVNPGVMSRDELAMLRPVAASMGLMLESVSERLLAPGGPHFGCQDKVPAARLACIEAAGDLRIPFTSGILIGIGETRRERIESLLALRDLHEHGGHLQEVIVQNFRAKPDTQMAHSVEPGLEDLLWSISVARLILPASMNIQAPPNLSPTSLRALLTAGINDWGGVSPLTLDYVNPEAPWPAIEQLDAVTQSTGQVLAPRLTVYPAYVRDADTWIAKEMRSVVTALQDAEGYARESRWTAGAANGPQDRSALVRASNREQAAPDLIRLLDRAQAGERLGEDDIVKLFAARGQEVDVVCGRADLLRERMKGDVVTYVVNRNINYTNMCYFACRFCAFSKGDKAHSLRGAAYDLPLTEIARRAREAWQRGATEVCLQGGIHPHYTGDTYIAICRAVKEAAPDIHVHAFSPLEVWHGATTLGLHLDEFLGELKAAGLGSLPGTAAEILDDEVRAHICPDKISTRVWLDVMRAAHEAGLASTATIMFGHLDTPVHWARHLLHIRDLQCDTAGFTEFVPLPFVHMHAPIHQTGVTRPGPTWREAILMHAISRLVLHPHIVNIQASWVKLGEDGVTRCLRAGVNDLGGSLMNESITRAAGAAHGEELTPRQLDVLARKVDRQSRQRTTLYRDASSERAALAMNPPAMTVAVNSLARRERPGGAHPPLRYGVTSRTV